MVKREALLDELWQGFMLAFDWLPLAATIDKTVFCCHAGIPRAIMIPSKHGWLLPRVDQVPHAHRTRVVQPTSPGIAPS